MRVFLNETVCPEFLGVNAVYHGFCYMPFQTERGMAEADAARELDRVAGIGLRLARTWYRPDWACGASLANPFDWESVEMRAFYRWLEAMRERGVQVSNQGHVSSFDICMLSFLSPSWLAASIGDCRDVTLAPHET